MTETFFGSRFKFAVLSGLKRIDGQWRVETFVDPRGLFCFKHSTWPGGMREAIRRPTRDGVLDNSTQVCLALLQACLDKVSDLNLSGGLQAQLTPP